MRRADWLYLPGGLCAARFNRLLQFTHITTPILFALNGAHVFYVFAEIAMACGHFAVALLLCVEPGEDPDKQAFTK